MLSTTNDATPAPKTRRPRQVPTKETIDKGFEEILEMISEELQRLKGVNGPGNTQKGMAKFLRSVSQSLKDPYRNKLPGF